MGFQNLSLLLNTCRNPSLDCGLNLNIQVTLASFFLLISSFYFFSKVRFFIRCILLFFAVYLTVFLSLPLSIFFKLLGWSKDCHYYVGRLFSFFCSLFLCQRYYVLDQKVLLELNQPCIFVCNHQSTLDIAYLGLIFPKQCSIMVKKSLQYIPFFGLYLKLSSTFMIDRQNHGKAMATTQVLAKTMLETKSGVLIFPEGTRSGLDTPTLLPFKKGAFHLALETGYPIVPIVFSNTSHLVSIKHRRFESGGMGIKVLDPIDPAKYSKETLHNFVEHTHSVMQTCLQEISAIDYNNYHL